MDQQDNNIKSRKNKHLNFEERIIIQIRLQDGYTPYKIAKELNRSINTILNEIRRGQLHKLSKANTLKCILLILVKLYIKRIG